MSLADVFQAFLGRPLQYKAQWISEHAHKVDDVCVLQCAQLVELVAHVGIIPGLLCNAAWFYRIKLLKYLDCNLKWPLRTLKQKEKACYEYLHIQYKACGR